MSRRGENIYKRKDGRWEGRYIKKYGFNKKAVYGYVYGHSYTEVKSKLSDAKSGGDKKNTTNTNSKVLAYYCAKWLDEEKKHLKPSTYAKYMNIVNNHLVPTVGQLMISDITTDTVKQFVEEKMTVGNLKTGKGLSTKSVKDIISVLHIVLIYAENKGEKIRCNFKLLSIKSEISQNEYLSKNEQMILTQYLINDVNYTKLGILICLYTGLRIGEICALQFKDISINEKVLSVSKTMQRIQNFNNSDEKTSIIITPPKSQKSVREIPIPDFLVAILKQYNNAPNAYLLTGKTDRFIEPRTLYNRFKV